MSRSYMKYLSVPTDEFYGLEWPSFRAKERNCIYKEMHSIDYGDIVFPKYYPTQTGSDSSSRLYKSRKEIRESYFLEIRNILNRYIDKKYRWICDINYYKKFIELFYIIKNGKDKPNKERFIEFKWLNYKKIKNIIKKWKGNPIDVIYYINRIGLIDQAVNWETKKYLKK